MDSDSSVSLLSFAEVARRLGGISRKSVTRLIARGDLPQPVKVLSIPTIPESELSKYIENQKNKRGGNQS